VSITLAAGLVTQLVFLAMWTATSRSTGTGYIMVAAGATAMGMRMNAIQSLHLPGMSTTAFTATYIAMVSGAATRSLTVSTARRLIGGFAGMVLGALLGDWMLSHAQPYAPLVPVLVVALVIAIASVGLDPKRDNEPFSVTGRDSR
jgi:ABC-type nitrate/sulfonate/bicarbonate transport system permease component